MRWVHPLFPLYQGYISPLHRLECFHHHNVPQLLLDCCQNAVPSLEIRVVESLPHRISVAIESIFSQNTPCVNMTYERCMVSALPLPFLSPNIALKLVASRGPAHHGLCASCVLCLGSWCNSVVFFKGRRHGMCVTGYLTRCTWLLDRQWYHLLSLSQAHASVLLLGVPLRRRLALLHFHIDVSDHFIQDLIC